jgi:hypothetical protein
MPSKRKLFIAAFSLLILILTFCCIIAGLSYYLPSYVESKLIPGIVQDAGLGDVACDVRRIGVTGADLGGLRIGDEDNPAFTVDSVRVDYSFRGLARGHIKRVVLSGIELHCEMRDGEFTIRGLDFSSLFPKDKSEENSGTSSGGTSSAVPFEIFQVNNAVVVWQWDGGEFRLPFDVEVVRGEKDFDSLGCTLRVYPRGQTIVSTAQIDLTEKIVSLEFDASGVKLEKLADLASFIPGLTLWGKGDMGGEACLRLEPFRITSAAASCEFLDAGLSYKGLTFQNATNGDEGKPPFFINIRGGNDEWRLLASSLSVDAAVPLKVSGIQCDILTRPEGVEVSGDLGVDVETFEGKETTGIGISEPIHLIGHYSAKTATKGEWEFRFNNTNGEGSPPEPQDFTISISNIDVTAGIPELDITGKGVGTQGEVEYKVEIPGLTADVGGQAVVRMPLSRLQGGVSLGDSGSKLVALELDVPAAEVVIDSAKIKVPRISLSGHLTEQDHSGLSLDGVVKFGDAEIVDSKLDLKAHRINAVIPFKWPCKNLGDKGEIVAGPLQWGDLDLGSVTGHIQQMEGGVVFDARYACGPMPGLTLELEGASRVRASQGLETKIEFKVPPYKTDSPVDLSPLLPSAQDTFFKGGLALEGYWNIGSVGAGGALNGKLQGERVEMKEKGFSIDGLEIDLSVTDLLNLRSAPSQRLVFKEVSLGDLRVNGGELDFHIESAKSVFIEKGSFGWCEGDVHLQGMRISAGIDSYDIVLYCDRLNLAVILEQFGAAKAEGSGTVNGRIPIRLENGKVSFGDGFLFSTPGDGGTVRLTGTEVLTAGIPPNTPQYAQVELAREALKDFDYDWAKVTLGTEGEDLVLRMQLDGKPAGPLPFVYKKELGYFVRAETGSQNSVFQGIRLDVNFRLPINRLLDYGDTIEGIRDYLGSVHP